MTEDLTIDGAAEAAANAARLLKNDAFNDAYASLIADIERQVFTTAPVEAEKREQMYYLHRAAQMFVNEIARRINEYELKRQSDLQYEGD